MMLTSSPSLGRRATLVVERVLRVLAAASLFSLFGLGSLCLGALVFLTSKLRRRDGANELRTQALIQRAFSAYLRVASAMGMISVRYRGVERLREGPSLVVANHPTLLDVVVLGALLPQCDCVVKEAAWNNFFLRGIIEAAGYISNSDGSALVRECSARLLKGRSVVLFPEGTRSPDSGLHRFGRAASHVALRTGCRIIPVVIRCEPAALKKGQPWYALPNECVCFDVAVGEAMHARDIVVSKTTPAIAARRVNDRLRSYFETELEHGVACGLGG